MPKIVTLSLFLMTTIAFASEERAQLPTSNSKYDVAPSGERKISGKIAAGPSASEFVIGETPFRFDQAKIVNGTSFGQESQKAMIGHTFDALLKGAEGDLVLTAAIPADLFSSRVPTITAKDAAHFRNSFAIPGHFTKDSESDLFKQYTNYRTTLFANGQVREGDSALVVTFSNGQGDDKSAIVGHFAFGRAVVERDGQLVGVVGSFYPAVNEKDIVPGFSVIEDYFGNLTSGQSQYRSTSTLIIYGLNDQAIRNAMRVMEKTFAYLRSHPKAIAVASFNCTSETCRALRSADLDVNLHSETRAPIPIDALTKRLAGTGAEADMFKRFIYFLFTDTAEILPRLAFENTLTGLLKNQMIGSEKASRVDYVFQGQIPSVRARGLLAPADLFEYLRDYLFYGSPRSPVTPPNP